MLKRYPLLADSTARCWHDTVICLSVHLSVTLCIVAKQYVLQQK